MFQGQYQDLLKTCRETYLTYRADFTRPDNQKQASNWVNFVFKKNEIESSGKTAQQVKKVLSIISRTTNAKDQKIAEKEH